VLTLLDPHYAAISLVMNLAVVSIVVWS